MVVVHVHLFGYSNPHRLAERLDAEIVGDFVDEHEVLEIEWEFDVEGSFVEIVPNGLEGSRSDVGKIDLDRELFGLLLLPDPIKED